MGIRASFLRRTANTSSTSSSLITSRRPDTVGVVGRDHQGQIPIGKAKYQVLLLFAKRLFGLASFDYGRAVVRIDDLVTDVEHHASWRCVLIPGW